MDVIKGIVEDRSLSPAEKVLFTILYCRKEGTECRMSVRELIHYVGVGLETVQKSLRHLEKGGYIRLKEDCHIVDATSFLCCAVLGEQLKPAKPHVPRP